MENSAKHIPRMLTQPALRPQIEIPSIRRTKSFTPSSPKAPPISPKDDTSLGPFGKLSQEIILEIFSCLTYRDLYKISKTCRVFRRLSKDKTLSLEIEKKCQHALKILREGIPVCIGFSSQSLKGMLDNRIKINPEIMNLQGENYIRALQNCEFIQKAIIDENGFLCSIAKAERIKNLKVFVLASDILCSKLIKFTPHEMCKEFKIKSYWESSKYKIKQNDEQEESPPRSPQRRTTWKLLKLECMGEDLNPTQKKVMEKVLKELNARPIETIIRSQGELKFVDGQDNF